MNHTLIYKCLVGSQSYGTSTPQSDFDYKGVYIQPLSDILSFGYKPLIEVGKDECYYEIKRLLELLKTANPTLLEMIWQTPENIIVKEPIFDLILSHKDKFLTKKCKNSFGGYAREQIKKAKGLNKMMNWEGKKITRKTVLDFCYVPYKQGTIAVKKWLLLNNLKQENCGLVALNHMRYSYGLFYKEEKLYKGIVKNEQKSNNIALSSITDKKELPLIIMYFNKDGYSIHCKRFNQYQTWLRERNVQRYVDVKGHQQQIDGKNLLHCVRLLQMSREIAEGKGIIVKRPNAEELLKIRRGEVSLQEIIDWAEKEMKVIDELFDKSNLPNEVNEQFVDDLLLEIRKTSYKLSI